MRFGPDLHPSPPAPATSDEEVRRLGREDPRRAVARLYQLHAPAVLSNLYLMLKDGETARDLTQEVFVRAFTREGLFASDVPFKPWLLKVASRLALNWVRENRRRTTRESRAEETRRMPDPLEEVLARQTASDLHSRLATLPIVYRQVLVLKYHEGLSCEEIARVLEVPPGTVMSHLYRARLVLRRRMSCGTSAAS